MSVLGWKMGRSGRCGGRALRRQLGGDLRKALYKIVSAPSLRRGRVRGAVPGARPANSRTRRPVRGGGAAIASLLDHRIGDRTKQMGASNVVSWRVDMWKCSVQEQ